MGWFRSFDCLPTGWLTTCPYSVDFLYTGLLKKKYTRKIEQVEAGIYFA